MQLPPDVPAPRDELPIPHGTPLHQITEDDLVELERVMPILCDRLQFSHEGRIHPELRLKVRRVKDILSNVRWNYQPYSEVHRVGDDSDGG